MGRRKHRSKAEWQSLIEQQASSGLNGVAFCALHGLSRKSFYRHRKVLGDKSTDLVSSPFIKVKADSVHALPLQPVAILHYRDSQLQLPVNTDPTWIAELIRALG